MPTINTYFVQSAGIGSRVDVANENALRNYLRLQSEYRYSLALEPHNDLMFRCHHCGQNTIEGGECTNEFCAQTLSPRGPFRNGVAS